MIKIGRNIEDSIVFYILLSLSCMNFLGKGSIVLLLFGLFSLLRLNFNLRVDRFFFVYLVFFGGVMISTTVFYTLNEIIKAANFILPYIVGCSGYRMAKNKESFIKRSVLAMVVGFSIYLIMMFFYNRQFNLGNYRVLYNVWTGEYLAATLIAVVSSGVLGYSCYVFVYAKKKVTKLLMAAVLCVVLMVNFMTATRSAFVVLALVSVVMFLIRVKDTHNVQRLRVFGIAVLVLLIGILVIAFDWFSIRTNVVGSFLWSRFQSQDGDQRLVIAWNHFIRMLDHPWGGSYIELEVKKSAHNFIQEIYDRYGAIAFGAALIIIIRMVVHVVALIKRPDRCAHEFLLIAMFISMGIEIMLEPVVTGFPMVLWMMLFLDGVVSAYLNDGAFDAALEEQT